MSWVDLESEVAEMFGELEGCLDRGGVHGIRVTRSGNCDGGVTCARRARDTAWLSTLPPLEWSAPKHIAEATLRLARRRQRAA